MKVFLSITQAVAKKTNLKANKGEKVRAEGKKRKRSEYLGQHSKTWSREVVDAFFKEKTTAYR